MVLLVSGCTTGAQNMAQELAFQRWRRCSTFSTISIQRIELDGRVVVTADGESQRDRFLQCMEDQVREQRRSIPGLVAPEPVVNALPR